MLNKSDIANELRQSIKTIRERINTQPGSAVNDIILTPLTDMVFKQRVRSQLISIFQSLDLVLDLLNDETLKTQTANDLDISVQELEETLTEIVEKTASNWGITRRSATKATGFVYFYISEDDYVSPITIPANTVVNRVDGIEYETPDQEYKITDKNFSSILNAYYVKVPITAIESGTQSNALASSIVEYPEGLQITGVINLEALSNGLNEQTNEELVEAVRLKLTGNNIGIEDGYTSLILDNFSYVDELLLVGPNDPEMQRNEFGGSIDVYIKGSLPTQIEYVMIARPDQQEYILNYLPASDISIDGYSSGIDYEFVKDELLFKDSARSNDKIVWLIDPPAQWVVKHTYDKLLFDIQSFLDDKDNKILDSDVLVRKAYEIIANVSLQVSLFSGYVFDDVEIQIQNIVAQHIFDLALNDSLLIADIIDKVQSLEAVENTRNVVITVDPEYQDLLNSDGDLIINRTQYISPGIVSVARI